MVEIHSTWLFQRSFSTDFDFQIFRGYAASCRVKRDDEEENIKKFNDNLEFDIKYEWGQLRQVRTRNQSLRDGLRRRGWR